MQPSQVPRTEDVALRSGQTRAGGDGPTPMSPARARLLDVQRSAGNRATARLVGRPMVQREWTDADTTAAIRRAAEEYHLDLRLRGGDRIRVRAPYANVRRTQELAEAQAGSREGTTIARGLHTRTRDDRVHPEGTDSARRLQRTMQRLIDQGECTATTEEGIRRWMRERNLGVDCTAFVAEAVELIHSERFREGERADPRRALGGGYGNTAQVIEGMAPGPAVAGVPQNLRPGDLMYLPNRGSAAHVRIVTQVHHRAAADVRPALPEGAQGAWIIVEMHESSGSRGGIANTRYAFPPGAAEPAWWRQGGDWEPVSRRDRAATYHRPRRAHQSGDSP